MASPNEKSRDLFRMGRAEARRRARKPDPTARLQQAVKLTKCRLIPVAPSKKSLVGQVLRLPHVFLLPDQPNRQRPGGRVALAVGHGEIEDVIPDISREIYLRRRRGWIVDPRRTVA